MDQSNALSLMEKLRSGTWHRHKAMERLPFVTALVEGRLPLDSYVGQLRGLAVIFSAMEQALADSTSPLLVRLRSIMKSRFQLLCEDLAFLASKCVPDILPAVRLSLEIAAEIRKVVLVSPGEFLGFIYVLEGTTRGNRVHLSDIKDCFHFPEEQGTAFYAGYGERTRIHWEEFSFILNQANRELHPAAMQGAEKMYEALERFHFALFPLTDSARGLTATALNPEAGDHPVPRDAVILEAALRAARRCWDEFPYFAIRYGSRGRRFADSDAAWLASLSDLSARVIADQVLWFGRVLSCRGMPTLLLERQLELLADELAGKGKAGAEEVLFQAAADLRKAREQWMPPDCWARTRKRLAELPVLSRAADLPDLPSIFSAALADQRAGIPECLHSLMNWLRKTGRAADEELDGIRAVLAAAYRAQGDGKEEGGA